MSFMLNFTTMCGDYSLDLRGRWHCIPRVVCLMLQVRNGKSFLVFLVFFVLVNTEESSGNKCRDLNYVLIGS